MDWDCQGAVAVLPQQQRRTMSRTDGHIVTVRWRLRGLELLAKAPCPAWLVQLVQSVPKEKYMIVYTVISTLTITCY